MAGGIRGLWIILLFAVTGYVSCDCPSNCRNNICDQYDRRCTSGCQEGFWGDTCVRICSEGCKDNTCNQNNGECSNGCHDGFYEATSNNGIICQPCAENCKRCNSEHCLECFDETFGENCDKPCPSGCKRCVSSWSGARYSTCIECKPGLYGINCMFNCSYCAEELCSLDSCEKGCIQGWHEYPNHLCVRCPSTCKTCDAWSWGEGKCLSCPIETWGDLCDNACSITCPNRTCDRKTGACECMPGSYLETENSVCRKCPESCSECTSPTKCTKCHDGKYGDICEHSCVANCLECGPEKVYNKDFGIYESCSRCEDGYYLWDTCHPCEKGCLSCWWMPRSQEEECRKCKEDDGYYQDKMEDRLILKCFKCPPGCKVCNSYGECFSCYEGYFQSEYTCCPNNCITCSSPTNCKSCKAGYYGNTCNITCPEYCETCLQDGSCKTCKPGSFSPSDVFGEKLCQCSESQCSSFGSEGSCSACKEGGWYPSNTGCCPCRHCKDSQCDGSGNCASGCASAGVFGAKCNLSCRDTMSRCANCSGGTVQTMKCVDCLSDFDYVLNDQCVSCSQNCRNGTCGRGGVCYGCKEGWAGDQCSFECGSRCKLTCEQSGCPECKDGYYGEKCHEECNEKCRESVCYRNNGSCTLGCIAGYKGDKCESRIVSRAATHDSVLSRAYGLLVLSFLVCSI